MRNESGSRLEPGAFRAVAIGVLPIAIVLQNL